MTATPEEADAVADRLFSSIEKQDIAALAEIYAADAVIWKNYNQIAVPAESSLAFLRGVSDYLSDVRYKEVRRSVFAGGFVQQHYFTGTIRETGKPLSLPVCVVAQVEGGKIKRIDEYLDSAHRLPVRA
ncbi:ketosteroid isomerase-like protein [Hephaestia caeni]|uniref:Ketosteroid isomerase-like protein n=1 Tax=Hephaestia caeni TaxID=645617 RepID=A0A397NTA4_9SPHN|nr:nuclear transport factor 2 family protein [Hephaestia caeni]RIA37955.1 ketosteroid isomerase-like protein [Hephaestia caeni]